MFQDNERLHLAPDRSVTDPSEEEIGQIIRLATLIYFVKHSSSKIESTIHMFGPA